MRSAHTYGPGETQATGIAETMTFAGAAGAADRRAGCVPFSLTFAVTGSSVT